VWEVVVAGGWTVGGARWMVDGGWMVEGGDVLRVAGRGLREMPVSKCQTSNRGGRGPEAAWKWAALATGEL